MAERLNREGTGEAGETIDAQLFGLGRLVQLLKRARRAAPAEELGFVMVNGPHALLG